MIMEMDQVWGLGILNLIVGTHQFSPPIQVWACGTTNLDEFSIHLVFCQIVVLNKGAWPPQVL